MASGRSRVKVPGWLACAGTLWLAVFSSHATTAEGAGNIWGSREPTICPSLDATSTPTEDEAAQLVKCRRESAAQSTGYLALMEDMRVSIDPARPFAEYYNSYDMPEADVTHDVHPIEGSWTWFNCIAMADASKSGDPSLNCTKNEVSGAVGVCWVTHGSVWQCNLTAGRSSEASGPASPPT